MQIDLDAPGSTDLYSLATHLVLPRPIAWVTTVNSGGVVNLAPFSYFGLICDDPILLVLSIGRRVDRPKDTARNLLSNGQGVVHVVQEALLEAMVRSSKDLAPDQSEVELAGLEVVPSRRVAVPRLAAAVAAVEICVERHLELGNDQNDVFLLRGLYAHVRDDMMTSGLPDPKRMRVVGKLGASDYAIIDSIRTVSRR